MKNRRVGLLVEALVLFPVAVWAQSKDEGSPLEIKRLAAGSGVMLPNDWRAGSPEPARADSDSTPTASPTGVETYTTGKTTGATPLKGGAAHIERDAHAATTPRKPTDIEAAGSSEAPIIIPPRNVPPPAAREGHNRAFRVATYPFRLYFTQTQQSYKDFFRFRNEGRSSRTTYFIEALMIQASSAFDAYATERLMNKCPGCVEANPVIRFMAGRRPTAKRLIPTTFFFTSVKVDLIHYMEKRGGGEDDVLTPMTAWGMTLASTLAGIWDWTGVPPAHAKQSSRATRVSILGGTRISGFSEPSRGLEEARLRIMRSAPIGVLRGNR
ncbi:MAG: hypothetical protein ABSF92_09110 [Candidatus Acidiferrales bacterium]|jgi:hypothetical protein